MIDCKLMETVVRIPHRWSLASDAILIPGPADRAIDGRSFGAQA